MNLQEEIVALIKELRNGRSPETNWPRLYALVDANLDTVVSTFSVRWLVSVCDTFADYGEPVQARHAMTISFFVNMLRLAETVKYTRPDVNAERWETARSKPIVPLYEGLFTFSIDRQDVFLNLSRRFRRQLADDRIMLEIWREILTRIAGGDNVITEFARNSAVGARYFPAEPDGMLDNYGL